MGCGRERLVVTGFQVADPQLRDAAAVAGVEQFRAVRREVRVGVEVPVVGQLRRFAAAQHVKGVERAERDLRAVGRHDRARDALHRTAGEVLRAVLAPGRAHRNRCLERNVLDGTAAARPELAVRGVEDAVAVPDRREPEHVLLRRDRRRAEDQIGLTGPHLRVAGLVTGSERGAEQLRTGRSRDEPLALAVHRHGVHGSVADGEDDPLAVRGPLRRRGLVRHPGQLCDGVRGQVEHVHAVAARPVADERDPLAVRRERGLAMVVLTSRELPQAVAVEPDHVEVVVPVPIGLERDLVARSERRQRGVLQLVGEFARFPTGGRQNPDGRDEVDGEPLAVPRPRHGDVGALRQFHAFARFRPRGPDRERGRGGGDSGGLAGAGQQFAAGQFHSGTLPSVDPLGDPPWHRQSLAPSAIRPSIHLMGRCTLTVSRSTEGPSRARPT